MQKQELEILKTQKQFEGKSYEQIKSELSELIKSQNTFKLLTKEKEQLLRQLKNKDKEIEKLKEELRKSNKKMFNVGLGLEKVEVKEKEVNIRGTANVFQLKRILCLLDSGDKINRNKIRELCGMNIYQIDSALLFLTNNKLISKEGDKYFK